MAGVNGLSTQRTKEKSTTSRACKEKEPRLSKPRRLAHKLAFDDSEDCTCEDGRLHLVRAVLSGFFLHDVFAQEVYSACNKFVIFLQGEKVDRPTGRSIKPSPSG